MHKKTILSGIYFLFTTTFMYPMQGDLGFKKDSMSTVRQTGSQKKPLVFKGVLYSLGVLAPAGAVLAYATSPNFKKGVNAQGDKAKHFLLQKCIVPLHLRIEEIKDEGVSKKDILTVLSVLVGAYGMKKAWDFFKIGHIVKKCELGPTKKALRTAASFIAANKKKAGAFSAGCAAACGGWWLWNTLYNSSEISYTDQFLLSLTDEQRMLIEKSELHSVLDQAKSDPLQMHSNEEFMKLLTDMQKNLVERIVEEYIKNNPHLAFVD